MTAAYEGTVLTQWRSMDWTAREVRHYQSSIERKHQELAVMRSLEIIKTETQKGRRVMKKA